MGIKMKRSAVVGKAPTTTDLNLGELGINTADGKLYLKKSVSGTESVVEVGPVASVAGKTGAVTLAKGDVGLGNVDNTSDANKPISTATQTALNGKQNSLGFTPVQQGGGAGQGTNILYVGWASSTLNLQVDTTDFGSLWPISAQRWNGASYTVSTSGPSGGADGDFWFERSA